MIFHDRNRVEALRRLPTLPRILLDLYAFDNIDPAEMARGLGADIATITLCLAEARSMIVARRLHQPHRRFDPATVGRPIARLEHDMRRHYRQWLQTTMIASGYDGAIQWPGLSADDDTEREAVAALILPGLPAKVRWAVARSGAARGISVIVWRYVPPWRTATRHHLDRLAREVHYSGWLPYDVWLADRIVPDHHYPDGLPIPRIIRRPLPDGEAAVDHEEGSTYSPEPNAMQEPFDRLPALTREAYFLHQRYGRTADEIAERLGIGRWSVKRRIRVALFVVITGSPPSMRHTLSFEFKLRWRRWRDRVHGAWKALRSD